MPVVGTEAVDIVYASANATRDLGLCRAVALTSMFGGSRTVVRR